MSDLEVLRQKNPNLASFIEQWRGKYGNRVFNFEKMSDQADFAEGMMEMARHMATCMQSASFNLNVCNDGVTGIEVAGSPKS